MDMKYTRINMRKINQNINEYIKELDLVNPDGKEFYCKNCTDMRTKYVGWYKIRHDEQVSHIEIYKCLYCGTIYEHEEIIPITNI